MRLVIQDTSDEVAHWAARYVMKRINDFKPSADKFFVLGLPTGERIQTHEHRSISFSLGCAEKSGSAKLVN